MAVVLTGDRCMYVLYFVPHQKEIFFFFVKNCMAVLLGRKKVVVITR